MWRDWLGLLLATGMLGPATWLMASANQLSWMDREGWNPGDDAELAGSRCNIERWDTFDAERFEREFRGRKPLIVREPTIFKHPWEKEDLKAFVRQWYDVPIVVFLPFDHPMVGGRTTTLGEYLRSFDPVYNHSASGEARLTEWGEVVMNGQVDEGKMLFDPGPLNVFPDLFLNFTRNLPRSLSPVVAQMCGKWVETTWVPPEAFEMAGEPTKPPPVTLPWNDPAPCVTGLMSLAPSGAGLPFHFHSEVCGNLNMWGRKRWFFSRRSPPYNPKHNTGRWVKEVYPTLVEGEREVFGDAARLEDIWECTTGPGEMMYVPPDTYHSTLAVGNAIGYAPHCRPDTRVPALATNVQRFPLQRPCGIGPNEKLESPESVDAVRRLVRAMPENGSLHFALAKFLVAEAEAMVAGAEAELRAAGRPFVLAEVGFLKRRGAQELAHRIRSDEAVSEAQEALRLNPLYSEAMGLLVAAYTLRGDVVQGIKIARQALRHDEQDATSCRRLGKLLLSLDPPRFDDARHIVSACMETVTDRLVSTESRECSLALFAELEQLTAVLVAAAEGAVSDSASQAEQQQVIAGTVTDSEDL
jgi:hypothetical protein